MVLDPVNLRLIGYNDAIAGTVNAALEAADTVAGQAYRDGHRAGRRDLRDGMNRAETEPRAMLNETFAEMKRMVGPWGEMSPSDFKSIGPLDGLKPAETESKPPVSESKPPETGQLGLFS